jgi:hypothetical protein
MFGGHFSGADLSLLRHNISKPVNKAIHGKSTFYNPLPEIALVLIVDHARD